ncbi:TRAP transporter substrate-binding protein DctP [Alloalcanivorax xenomutans]|uniref:TRAP transporter substrate-binding protein DctP n=1 Tax=Alloalcanivorax xenomutans TaxID=1094342 RepID=UPI003BAC2FF0
MIQCRRFFPQLGAALMGIITLALPALPQAQEAYKDEYRLSLVPSPGTAWYTAADNFATKVREGTDGRINIRLYPGSSLVQGAQDRELAALRQGVIDLLVGPGANWSGTVKDFAVFGLPTLMSDSKAVDAVLASDALNKDFYDIVRRSGMEPLASGEYGYVQLLNAKHRLANPDAAAGLKIRVVASPMQQDIMNALGTNPTSMSWADAQSALSTGAVDGLMLTMEQMQAVKVYSLGVKYVTRWNLLNSLIHFAVATPVFQSWTPEDQEIVRLAAQEAARELTREVRDLADSSVQALEQNGVEVYTPTPEERAEWRERVRQPYEKWKQRTNPELVTKLEQAINRARDNQGQ